MTEQAEVTREHRLAALLATYPEAKAGALWANERHWVDTGEAHAGRTPQLFLPRVAQALANAEAKGRAESSAEVTRLQGEVARLEAELSDWRLVKGEPVVVGRLATIKAAKPKHMVGIGRFPITPVTSGDDRLGAAGPPVCTRCKEYLAKSNGLCSKCIQRGPATPRQALEALANIEARGKHLDDEFHGDKFKAAFATIRAVLEAPAPASAELEADWSTLKSTYVIGAKGCDETCTVKNCVVKRIEAALSVKKEGNDNG